eukprot:363852-Chlamydomonas_euryale.AAC.2
MGLSGAGVKTLIFTITLSSSRSYDRMNVNACIHCTMQRIHLYVACIAALHHGMHACGTRACNAMIVRDLTSTASKHLQEKPQIKCAQHFKCTSSALTVLVCTANAPGMEIANAATHGHTHSFSTRTAPTFPPCANSTSSTNYQQCSVAQYLFMTAKDRTCTQNINRTCDTRQSYKQSLHQHLHAHTMTLNIRQRPNPWTAAAQRRTTQHWLRRPRAHCLQWPT